MEPGHLNQARVEGGNIVRSGADGDALLEIGFEPEEIILCGHAVLDEG
jgi:hypothetical protein